MITFVSNDRYETKESVILFMLDSHLDIIGNRTGGTIIHCHARLARPFYRSEPEEGFDRFDARRTESRDDTATRQPALDRPVETQ